MARKYRENKAENQDDEDILSSNSNNIL